jgi:hypothetical protein
MGVTGKRNLVRVWTGKQLFDVMTLVDVVPLFETQRAVTHCWIRVVMSLPGRHIELPVGAGMHRIYCELCGIVGAPAFQCCVCCQLGRSLTLDAQK